MATAWESQPDLVADKIIKRAQVGKIGRKLKATLALANFKTARGWEDLPLDVIEPRVDEEIRRRRPTSSGDVFSDSSSTTTTSEHRYRRRQLMSSPLKAGPIFSDAVDPRSGSSSLYSGHRKRTYNSFELPSSSDHTRKRTCSSPVSARHTAHHSWKNNYQLPQSSPIKPRKQAGFSTSSGPNISFYKQPSDDIYSSGFTSPSDDEEDALPLHSFNVRTSPRTPPPSSRNRFANDRTVRAAKTADDGADLLLYLATSPSPAKPTTSRRMQPPSTPPPKNMALPSSMMNTPGAFGTPNIFSSGFGAPNTPSQNFDFADFVNITPSPAQNAFSKTPRILKTPSTITRRRLTFEPVGASPQLPTSSARQTAGLGMQLGGDLPPR